MGEALEVRVIALFLAGQMMMRVGTIREDRFAELALSRDEVEIRIPKALQSAQAGRATSIVAVEKIELMLVSFMVRVRVYIRWVYQKWRIFPLGRRCPDPLPLLPENRGNEGRAVK